MSASALYEGWVRHRRHEPVAHEFTYPLFMTLLDLDELPAVLDPLAGWSARRPALAWFRRSDHLGDPRRPLAECVRDAVEAELGSRPSGPVRVLTNLRMFGHCFNPVSFHFCFASSGDGVEALLADVSNTPWRERHAYAIAGTDSRVIAGRIAKRFHVSPLLAMDHTYEWRTTVPGSDVQVHIASTRDGRTDFDATLSLRRRELAPDTARRMLIRYPAMTAQVVARIYSQALRLRLKGAPWHAHPGRAR
jgi:uncharacterized protein